MDVGKDDFGEPNAWTAVLPQDPLDGLRRAAVAANGWLTRLALLAACNGESLLLARFEDLAVDLPARSGRIIWMATARIAVALQQVPQLPLVIVQLLPDRVGDLCQRRRLIAHPNIPRYLNGFNE